ncbi:MAG TPA: molybdenum cofactor biosynthesis protein MoaE [Lysobacter sp.]
MDASAFHCEVVDVAAGRLDPAAALDFVSDPAFGGLAMFVGKIRDHNVGRAVTGISYDMFDALALNVFADAARQAAAEVGPRLRVYVAHAKGRLSVGDIAVVVAAGTPHRDEAFRACRSVIEAVKHTAPIWKQEHYLDGSSEWSEGCSLCPGGDVHAAAAGHAHADYPR